MDGTKLMLLGIAVILLGIAIATMNFFGWCGGALGFLLALIGLFLPDRRK